MNIDQQLDARHNRRLAAEHRFLVRLEKREKAAEPQVGELIRNGKIIYYCWPQGGRYFESSSRGEVIGRLIRNNYA